MKELTVFLSVLTLFLGIAVWGSYLELSLTEFYAENCRGNASCNYFWLLTATLESWLRILTIALAATMALSAALIVREVRRK